MSKKFKDLTVDYKKLLALPVFDRYKAAESGGIQNLLSSITPQQYAALFPTYYRDRLPDISGFLSNKKAYAGSDNNNQTTTSGMSIIPPRTPRIAATQSWERKLNISSVGANNKFEDKGLGSVSAKYEGKVGTVGGDGGRAYGKFQFDYKVGGLQRFFEDNPEYAMKFEGLKPGTPEFDNRWKQIAETDSKGFEAAQNKSAQNIWYNPAKTYGEKLGFKIDNRGIQEAIFSGSIQHGGINKIIDAAASSPGFKDMTPEQQVQAFYNARRNYSGVQNLDPGRRAGVLSRYDREEKDARTFARGETPEDFISKDNSQQSGPSSIVQKQQSVAQTRKLSIKPELENYLDYAAKASGVQFEVTSGGQTRDNKVGSNRHNVDNPDTIGAADGRMFVVENGRKRYLSVTNENDQEKISSFTKAFASVAPSSGIGADYMGSGESRGQLFHFGGGNKKDDSPLAYEGPEWFRRSHLEGVKSFGSDETKGHYAAYQAEKQKRIEEAANKNNRPQISNVSEVSSEEKNKLYAEGIKNVFGTTRKSPSDIIPTDQSIGSPGMMNTNEQPKPNVDNKPVEKTYQETTASPGSPGATGSSNTVNVLAKGGVEKTNTDKIEAYPIGALKGDGAVVVDASKKPLFTMNTSNELAVYDPKTKNVTVDPMKDKPNQSAQGKAIPVLAEGGSVKLETDSNIQTNVYQKTDPRDLNYDDTITINDNTNDKRQQDISNRQELQNHNLMSTTSTKQKTIDVHDNILASRTSSTMCPSFARAIAATRFQRSADFLGGHYDGGSTNLT